MYTAYYFPRSDGDWDLVAVVAGRDEIDNDISDNVKLGIDRAFGGMQRELGEPMTVEQNDPEFPQVWSEDPTSEKVDGFEKES
jgi:hypothetical protein